MSIAFDPTDPALAADPHGVYRRLRDEAPALRTEIGGGTWLVTRYDDVKRIVRDNDGRMQPPGHDAAGGAALAGGPAERIYRGLMVLNDPPVHTRLRKLADVALTRRAVELLRDDVERVVAETFDAVLVAGDAVEADAVSDLAFVVPLRVICGMLDIPEEDRMAFLQRTPDFFRIFLPNAQDDAGIAACHEACGWFIDYLGAEIERRRAHDDGREDIFSRLIRAEADGDKLSADELTATVLSLLTGGFDTTMGTIAGGIEALAAAPDQLEALRADPAGRARAMSEEALRLESPVQITLRHLPEDTPVAGATIPAGETAWLVLASANRDERRFPDPHALDIARGDDKHLAFGGSRHFCIGNHLARLELDVTFRVLGERVAAIEQTGDAPRRPNLQFRSLERLPVRLRATEGA